MRAMKKIMTGMSVTAFALAIAGGVNATEADAAGSATFDAVAQTMTAKGTGEVHVSFNAIKVATKKVKDDATGTTTQVKTLTLNASAAWDVYDGASAVVDLSNLKTTADQYIAVKDTTTAVPAVYYIPANTDKFTGAYGVEGTKGGLTFKDGQKNETATEVTINKKLTSLFQYRTVNANVWTDYASGTFATSQYEKQGATLYFRQKAVAIAVPTKADQPTADLAFDTTSFNLYKATTGNFAGAEFKVKIGKEANAPSATVNYDTWTFTVKQGQEYRQKAAAAWTAVTDKTATIKLTSTDVKAAGIFEVRTAATTDKKVASKIKVYSYAAATAPVAAEFNLENVTTTSKKGTVSDPSAYAMEGKVNVYYNLSSAGLAQINFLNLTDTAYTVYDGLPYDTVDSKGNVTAPASGKVITALPAKAKKAITKTETVVKPGTSLYIVKNSNKSAGVFRSLAYNVIAKVTYPTSPVLVAGTKANNIVAKALADASVTPQEGLFSYYYGTDKNGNTMNFWNKTANVIMIYDKDPNTDPTAKLIINLPVNPKKAVTVAASKLPVAGQPIYIVAASNFKEGTFRTAAYSAIKVTYPK